MQIYSREVDPCGHVHVRIFGMRVLSYRRRRVLAADERLCVHGVGNVLENIPPWCRVCVYGEGNRVVFSPSKAYFAGEIHVGTQDCPVKGCEVVVGEEVVCNGCNIFLMEDGSRVLIGNRSLLSSDVEILCTDTHAVFSPDGMLLNRGRYIEIGEHCWIGKRAFVLKNTRIGRDSIVGACSVVSGGNDEPGVIWAGNPARIVRRGISWDARRPNSFVQREHKEDL